jgi:hypothetical protein
MIIIAKFILISLLLLVFLFYLLKIRSKLLDRLLFIIFFMTGVFFIIYPDITTSIAHTIGINRGADLIFYLAIVFFFFGLILLYSMNKELEKKLTDLIRNDAIENAGK